MGLRKRLRKGMESVFRTSSSPIQTAPKNEVAIGYPIAPGEPPIAVTYLKSAGRLRDIPTTSTETRNSGTSYDSVDAANRLTATFSDAHTQPKDGKDNYEEGVLNPNTSGTTEAPRAEISQPTSSNESDRGSTRVSIRDMGSFAVETTKSEFFNVVGKNRENMAGVGEENIASAPVSISPPVRGAETSIYDRKLETPISEQSNSNTETPVIEKNSDSAERAMVSSSSNESSFRPKFTHANDENVPSASSRRSPTAMFDGLQNTYISGGTFVQNIMSSNRPGFKLLQKQVASSAFHNSAQRFDPPRCHPDTRVSILQTIYDWIIQSNDRDTWLLWLNGAAGAGKSAIIQSIAERCAEAAIAIASFFFFRTDSSRNAIAPLVATLAYQLMQVIPETSEDILQTIERNPLIFDQSFESQLQQLLVQPLLRLPRDLQRLFVVFIDGLDECNDRDHQSKLITVLGNVSRSRNCPIVFLIASRREPQIEATFVHKQVSDLVLTLPLDNSDIEQTSDDIRSFLTDKFNDIKETHLRRRLLPTDWPLVSVVEEIVSKSSGQFIYSSVVVKYVSSPRANPAHQLDIISGLRSRDASSQNPFAHLDALYQHIFSQVAGLDKVFDILGYLLAISDREISYVETTLLLEPGDVEVYLSDLTAVIECGSEEIKFLHASLPDFLLDKSRSEDYHIDIDKYTTKLLCILLDRVPRIHDPPADTSDVVDRQESFRIYSIRCLLKRGVTVSDRLRRSFMNFNFTYYKIDDLISAVRWAIAILTHLGKLDFGDQKRAYHHVLEVFAVELSKNCNRFNSEDKDLVKTCPDLDTRINQILQEQA